jgi:CheY-like chemotaxis protein
MDQISRDNWIMLVEDDVDLRETMGDVLAEDGYETVTARDGAEAMAHLRSRLGRGETLPRAIVLDLMMPRKNGWAFCAELRGDRQLAGIPVVVLTGANLEHLPPIDAAAVLRKPVKLIELVRALRTVGGQGSLDAQSRMECPEHP